MASMNPPTPITHQQRERILVLLQRGGCRDSDIARMLGIRAKQVECVRSHITMGTYGSDAVGYARLVALRAAAGKQFGGGQPS
jgi:hypothetical protein